MRNYFAMVVVVIVYNGISEFSSSYLNLTMKPYFIDDFKSLGRML